MFHFIEVTPSSKRFYIKTEKPLIYRTKKGEKKREYLLGIPS